MLHSKVDCCLPNKAYIWKALLITNIKTLTYFENSSFPLHFLALYDFLKYILPLWLFHRFEFVTMKKQYVYYLIILPSGTYVSIKEGLQLGEDKAENSNLNNIRHFTITGRIFLD